MSEQAKYLRRDIQEHWKGKVSPSECSASDYDSVPIIAPNTTIDAPIRQVSGMSCYIRDTENKNRNPLRRVFICPDTYEGKSG